MGKDEKTWTLSRSAGRSRHAAERRQGAFAGAAKVT